MPSSGVNVKTSLDLRSSKGCERAGPKEPRFRQEPNGFHRNVAESRPRRGHGEDSIYYDQPTTTGWRPSPWFHDLVFASAVGTPLDRHNVLREQEDHPGGRFGYRVGTAGDAPHLRVPAQLQRDGAGGYRRPGRAQGHSHDRDGLPESHSARTAARRGSHGPAVQLEAGPSADVEITVTEETG
jgi:hypothetical protein